MGVSTGDIAFSHAKHKTWAPSPSPARSARPSMVRVARLWHGRRSGVRPAVLPQRRYRHRHPRRARRLRRRLPRPAGRASFFGHFGDRVGRRSMLMVAMVGMGTATTAIRLLPNYTHIGIWSRSCWCCCACCKASRSAANGGRALDGAGPARRRRGWLFSHYWSRSGFRSSWSWPCTAMFSRFRVCRTPTSGPGAGVCRCVPVQRRAGRHQRIRGARLPENAGVPDHQGAPTEQSVRSPSSR